LIIILRNERRGTREKELSERLRKNCPEGERAWRTQLPEIKEEGEGLVKSLIDSGTQRTFS